MLRYFLPVVLAGATLYLLVQVYRLFFLLWRLLLIKCGFWKEVHSADAVQQDKNNYVVIINPFYLQPTLGKGKCGSKELSALTKYPTSETPLLSDS